MPTPGATKRVKPSMSLRELNFLRDSKEYIHAAEGRDARQVQSHTSPLVEALSGKVLLTKASSASVQSPRPNAQSTKSRLKGVSIHRSFVYGSIAKPFDTRPAGVNADHTHQWSIFVKGIDGEDISYWLKKVQFKLHETYTNNMRGIESPPFEVTETGWGEFDVQIKLYFVPEANEKPAILWHQLKLHPYGPDADAQRERKDEIVSQSYEEIVFNEPFEPFYDILTSGPPPPPPGARGKSKGSKQASLPQRKVGGGHRTAQLPFQDTPGNPYSQKTEGEELDRLKEAIKSVEISVKEEQIKMHAKEKELARLKKELEPPKKK